MIQLAMMWYLTRMMRTPSICPAVFDEINIKTVNEPEGAWHHSRLTEIERAIVGAMVKYSYIFAISRSLQTASEETYAHIKTSKAIDIGFAFWVNTSTSRSSTYLWS